MNHNVCPAPTEELTIEQILSKTHAMSQGDWVAAIAQFNGTDHIAVGVAGSTKAVAVFGPTGADDEDESIANAELFVHIPRLRRELIALREQESDDLAQARADYDRSCEKLAAIRSGMIALYDRYHALHICASRYLKEWPNETPKGWSLDELEACLEMPLPQTVPALDPDLACQQREEIQDWVVGCKGSLYAVVLQRLLAQSDELLRLKASGTAEMATLKGAYKTVRTALEGIVDARAPEELKAMESIMAPIDDENAKISLTGIRALLATMDVSA